MNIRKMGDEQHTFKGKKRSETTLFMLMSIDGKISTGERNDRDVDKDFPVIPGIKEGLFQYYEREQKTDFYSLNTGKVMEKIGVNEKQEIPHPCDVSFILIDNQPHLNKHGITYLTKWLKNLYVVTTNPHHPACEMSHIHNLEILLYQNTIHFPELFRICYHDYHIDKITIQSGGTLNAQLIRQNLIDHLSLIMAPCLIGGGNTPTLMDGESLSTQEDLQYVKTLVFRKCEYLQHSYLHLLYDVVL